MHTYLKLVDPTRNHNKHYWVSVVPHGARWEVWTAWGRIGSTPQEKMVGNFGAHMQAEAEAKNIVAARLGKGYVVATPYPASGPRWAQPVIQPQPPQGNHGVQQNQRRFEAELMSALSSPPPTKPLVEEKPKKQDVFTERKNAAKWNF